MQTKQFWAIVPAAGVGKRMLADRPKQYLTLQNKTVIEHTLDKLLSLNEISGVVLSISETDEYWPELKYHSDKPVLITHGGKERSDSVLNALTFLNNKLSETENTWVLVHDAARPCVRKDDIQKLIKQGSLSDDGGLLALPVRDTMKRSAPSTSDDKDKIQETVDRNGLWHALTPQMFKLDILYKALCDAQKNNSSITDDASAMELAGYKPILVEGHEDNIKITRAFDLQLAHLFLANQN